jgi:hypothetical protein
MGGDEADGDHPGDENPWSAFNPEVIQTNAAGPPVRPHQLGSRCAVCARRSHIAVDCELRDHRVDGCCAA